MQDKELKAIEARIDLSLDNLKSKIMDVLENVGTTDVGVVFDVRIELKDGNCFFYHEMK